jgi:hypothetical protein
MSIIWCHSCGEELKISDLTKGTGGKAECIYCGALNELPGGKKEVPAARGQNWLAIGIGIVVLIVGVGVIVAIQMARARAEAGKDHFICLECGTDFRKASKTSPVECTFCQRETGVRRHFFKCKKCGEVFEAYRSLVSSSSRGKIVEDVPPSEVQVCLPGGSWEKGDSELGRRCLNITCAGCGVTGPENFEEATLDRP